MNKLPTTAERNPAELAVLGILVHGNAHGYDVYRELKESLGSVHRLGRSQVYGLLSRLERDGLIEHERVDQEGVPAKKVFSPTSLGKSLVHEWVRTPVDNVRDLRVEFLTKLYFAEIESPETERELLHAQIAVCRERASELETQLELPLNSIERHAFEYRLAMVNCSVTWLENIAAEAMR